MNIRIAQEFLDRTFLEKAANDAEAYAETIAQRKKDFLRDKIRYYSKTDEGAKAIGYQDRGVGRNKNSDTAAFAAWSDSTAVLALVTFNDIAAANETAQKVIQNLMTSFREHTKVPATTATLGTGYEVQSVTHEFAAHVNDYVATHVAAAPQAANNVLAKPAEYMIPWAPNVMSVKDAFHSGLTTQEEAMQQLSTAILNNNGIHSVENGREHFLKAAKLYEMKAAFKGSTESTPSNNMTISIFNQEAVKPAQPEIMTIAPVMPARNDAMAFLPTLRYAS